MTAHASASEIWKRKYYDAIEELDRREKTWARTEEVLRRAISRLSLAADGLDEALDEALARLRNAIRDQADARILEQHLERISHLLVKLDQRRAREAALPGPAELFIALLDALPHDPDRERALRPLRKRLARAGSEDVEDLVREVAEALSAQWRSPAGQPAEGGRRRGLFSRRRRTESEAVAAAVSDSLDTGPLRQLIEHLRDRGLAAERVDDWRERLARDPDTVVRELAEHWPLPTGEAQEDQPAHARLADLVGALPLPETFRERAAAIERELREGSLRVEAGIEQIAVLVGDLRRDIQREKREIQDFLEQLTERLALIDSAVQEADAARLASYEEGRRLGDAVRDEVRGIETGVREARDLTELRVLLQVRIEGILHHIEEHRRLEEARKAAEDDRVAELTERLRALEQEAETLREQVRSERKAALTDALTGIPNRLAWEERVEQEFARWRRFGTPLAILVWDIDHFKAINDRYGHKAGDKVLKAVAELLSGSVRSTDFVARYGGEEFVMLAAGAGPEEVLRLAEALREAVRHCGFRYRGERVEVTISCGIAMFRDGDTIESAFQRADAALYAAKRAGRNRCVLEET